MDAADAPDPRLARGVALFNREEFFDAHEVVEDLWNDTHGADRDLLKGFIQAAVACEHHRRGNRKGMRSVGRTAAGHLGKYPPEAGGLDVAGLLRDLEAFLAAAERDASPRYPRVRLLAGPAPEAGAGAAAADDDADDDDADDDDADDNDADGTPSGGETERP